MAQANRRNAVVDLARSIRWGTLADQQPAARQIGYLIRFAHGQ